MRTAATGLAIVLSLFGAVHHASSADAAQGPNTDEGRQHFRPCKTEDAAGPCVWDARHMGNGVGESYIVRKDGSVDYVTHKQAHEALFWDECVPAEEFVIAWCIWDGKHSGDGSPMASLKVTPKTVTFISHRKAHFLLSH